MQRSELVLLRFIGNIASQGVAKAMELQEGISLKGALITGLATAASSGLLRGLNGSKVYQQFTNTMDELSVSKAFSISSAAQLMEQNALSQSISLSLQKHQHFDWEQLAVSGVTAGLMGGALGSKLDKTLRGLDHNTGMLTSELRALTNAGLNIAVAGSQLNALDVLQDNLGAAIGSAITDKRSELEQSQITGKDLARLKLKEIDEMDEYCPIPTEEGAYSSIPEGTYERFHQEILAHQRAAALALEQEEQDSYDARKLSGSEGYESAQPHLTNQQTRSLGNYERLPLDSDLFKSSNDGVHKLGFESQVYWNSKEHGMGQFVEDSAIRLNDFMFSKINKIEHFYEEIKVGLSHELSLDKIDPKIRYIVELYPLVHAASQKSGLSLELMLAQGAQETGWGANVLPGTNNMFNIKKGDTRWKGPVKRLDGALEYRDDGTKYFEPSSFRVYKSIEESVQDRVEFLRSNKRYAELFKPGIKGNAEKEAFALQRAKYAGNNPHYADSLIQVMKGPTMKKAIEFARNYYGY
ncbi:glycoside hydrolase family 73 protein [Legionella fallonii]|uniref:Mannosyl-glycoprotein endo-beta-N-acetylglucosamidase-like domain-containing protein n=1 Tax=Legionella fallonii LLAP-10 TaxID=1212491 RepID=A0A098G460_9GAMM|nr:glucosaminidase domain-containing protein [Legionella fallonii]CEG56769.1 protein of unknown function [Glucosaminidase] [Legionella fallonii LLAP-10]